MATYFLHWAYTEHRGFLFIKLEEPTVLAWFQALFENPSEDCLRTLPDGFGLFVQTIEGESLPVPETHAELAESLRSHLYVERDLDIEPHFIDVQTADGEYDTRYFFFDDTFLKTEGALDALPNPDSYPQGYEHNEDTPEEEEWDEGDEDDYDVLNYRTWMEERRDG